MWSLGLYTFRMAALPDAKAVTSPISVPTRRWVIWSAARYLAGKTLTVLATIFVAVLITMVIVDLPVDVGGGQKMSLFQIRLENQIYWVLDVSVARGLIETDAWGNPVQAEWDALEQKLRSQAGLDLPFLPRYLLWTYKALTFSWGELDPDSLSQIGLDPELGDEPPTNIVLGHLPNTHLLVGTAYLLVLLIGMPFSLYLARH